MPREHHKLKVVHPRGEEEGGEREVVRPCYDGT